MDEQSGPRLPGAHPPTGQPGPAYKGHTWSEALAIVADARSAFTGWRATPIEKRAVLMSQAAAVLRRRAGEFAELMTAEMGKPHTDGLAEIEKCAFNCDVYAEKAATFLARRPVDIGGPKAFVTYNPLGVVLAVMPRNFPFW